MPRTAPVPGFAELLLRARRSAVHLETRDSYAVTAEAEDFAAWRCTGRRDTDPRSAYWAPWVARVRDAVARGVSVRRARIVSEPVSEYIRYEYAGTGVNIMAGEDVRWLPRRGASGIALPGNDFWLFDGWLARFNHFSGDGVSTGPSMSEDPAIVGLCATAFEAVWERAVPHEKYTV